MEHEATQFASLSQTKIKTKNKIWSIIWASPSPLSIYETFKKSKDTEGTDHKNEKENNVFQ